MKALLFISIVSFGVLISYTSMLADDCERDSGRTIKYAQKALLKKQHGIDNTVDVNLAKNFAINAIVECEATGDPDKIALAKTIKTIFLPRLDKLSED